MKKSPWIELIEWTALALIFIFVVGVFAMRGEILSASQDNPDIPVQSLGE